MPTSCHQVNFMVFKRVPTKEGQPTDRQGLFKVIHRWHLSEAAGRRGLAGRGRGEISPYCSSPNRLGPRCRNSFSTPEGGRGIAGTARRGWASRLLFWTGQEAGV